MFHSQEKQRESQPGEGFSPENAPENLEIPAKIGTDPANSQGQIECEQPPEETRSNQNEDQGETDLSLEFFSELRNSQEYQKQMASEEKKIYDKILTQAKKRYLSQFTTVQEQEQGAQTWEKERQTVLAIFNQKLEQGPQAVFFPLLRLKPWEFYAMMAEYRQDPAYLEESQALYQRYTQFMTEMDPNFPSQAESNQDDVSTMLAQMVGSKHPLDYELLFQILVRPFLEVPVSNTGKTEKKGLVSQDMEQVFQHLTPEELRDWQENMKLWTLGEINHNLTQTEPEDTSARYDFRNEFFTEAEQNRKEE